MKKVTVIALAALFGLAACNKDEEHPSDKFERYRARSK